MIRAIPVFSHAFRFGPILAGTALAAALLLAAPPAGAAGPTGRWLAEDILGGGVHDRLQTTLEIRADGRVSGSGGCNRYTGKATLSGAGLSFGPMASTRMACAPVAMSQEQRFFQALQGVKSWRLSREGKLELLDGAGKVAVRLDPMR